MINIRGNTQIPVKPFGVYYNWDLKTSQHVILTKASEIITRTKRMYEHVASAKTLSFENILKPILEAHRLIFCSGAVITFPRHVSESPIIRDTALIAVRLLDDASVEMSMRKDVFDKLVAYKEEFSAEDNLRPEHSRCLDRMIHSGRRNGLHLSQDVRTKITKIKKRTAELQLQFSHNLTEEEAFVLLSYDDLSGMPFDFIDMLEICPVTKKYRVSLKSYHFFPIIRKCRVPETRRIMETYYQSKCLPENATLLEEILELRQKEAKLLGYENHAAYIQDVLMAKNPQTVKKFLLELTKKLKPLWEIEKKQMLQLKKEECEKYNFPYKNQLEIWDFRYYMTMVEEKLYIVDQAEVVEYFPLDSVTHQMMGIYEQLLHLRFNVYINAQKWNEDVVIYQVSDRLTNRLLGYIYLDLFARRGKFGHPCCVPLQIGCLDMYGKRQCSVAAMLMNFNRPIPGKSCLLDHKEVEQFFHEFGHLMHTLCSTAETAIFFGTRVETDFVEAPSQMLENWVWNPETLIMLSRHHIIDRRLPYQLMQKVIISRRANAAGLNLRQVVLAILDQEIHSGGRCDTQKLYAKILKDIMGFNAIPGTNMAAHFNHICVGYSGRYYSYLWSEVFSMDMFKTTFEKHGVMNRDIGLRYRRCILEPGGSMDAVDMLRNFLGREPNNMAFLESKGLPSN